MQKFCNNHFIIIWNTASHTSLKFELAMKNADMVPLSTYTAFPLLPTCQYYLHPNYCWPWAHVTNNFSLKIQTSKFKISFCCHAICNKVVNTKWCCTCHHNCVIVTCAKFCSDLMGKILNHSKIFISIWVEMWEEKYEWNGSLWWHHPSQQSLTWKRLLLLNYCSSSKKK